MLFITNRITTPAPDPSAFTTAFRPFDTALSMAEVQRGAAGGHVLDAVVPDASDDQLLQRLVPMFSGGQPVLVYLHGNNNPPGTAMERCSRLAELYGCALVGFSWPSEGFLSDGSDHPGIDLTGERPAEDLGDVRQRPQGEGWVARKIRRYHQAKQNAMQSLDATARFLRLLATAQLYVNHQPFTLAAHSLGSHLLQHTMDVGATPASLGAAQNIVLLAPCCRADSHAQWVGRLAPRGQVFVTYHPADSVLFGAWVADGQELKLGAQPGERLHHPRLRYISFANAPTDVGAHGYFVRDAGKSMPKAAGALFGRIFNSQTDLQADELDNPRKVYRHGCDADRSTCWMGRPDASDGVASPSADGPA